MAQLAIIYITAPSKEEGQKIAAHLLEKKLVACVNMTQVESSYRWQGNVVSEPEVLLLVKTLTRNISLVRQEIMQQHPYTTPCILTVPVEANEGYAAYVQEQVTSIED